VDGDALEACGQREKRNSVLVMCDPTICTGVPVVVVLEVGGGNSQDQAIK
jgi:hypothetical protein